MPRRASSENVVKFTKSAVASLTVLPGQSERIVWDADLHSFGIRIRASGNRAWVIRPPRSGGQSRLHTIGSVDAIDITTARQTAREKLGEVALGGDPTKARKEARAKASVTVGSLIPRYLADKEQRLRPSSLSNAKNHLNNHWRPLHDRPLTDVTRAEVAARHREVAQDRGPHAADRARAVLSGFFTWAIREGLTEQNPVTNTNTATKPTSRERVLSNEELAAVWKSCRDDDYGRIVRLLILTGLRRTEVAGMRWDEIDMAKAMWSIPASRMKNKRPHTVPLSREALDIIAAVPERVGRECVFGSGKGAFSGFSKAKKSLDKRLDGAAVEWTVHDLRRTTATGMNTIGVLPHIVEAVLSHVSVHKAGVAGTYNRAAYKAEKRDALDRWSSYVTSL